MKNLLSQLSVRGRFLAISLATAIAASACGGSGGTDPVSDGDVQVSDLTDVTLDGTDEPDSDEFWNQLRSGGGVSGFYRLESLMISADESLTLYGDTLIQVIGTEPVTIAGLVQSERADDGTGVSFAVEAAGDIVVSGTIDLGDGADTQFQFESAGRDGGSVALQSEGKIDLVDVQGITTGDGGDGGIGGPGGNGGDLVLEGVQIVMPEGEHVFYLGDGGDGGDRTYSATEASVLPAGSDRYPWVYPATGGSSGSIDIDGAIVDAEDSELLSFCELIAGGGGGNAGATLIQASDDVADDIEDLVFRVGAKGGPGELVGGRGGDIIARGWNGVGDRAGQDVIATGGDGGHARNRCAGTVSGGDGGDAEVMGGHPGPTGARPGDATASGGAGGGVWFTGSGTEFHGGAGGNAIATGGDAGTNFMGGSAWAFGGVGGSFLFFHDDDNTHAVVNGGDGGDAEAVGGDGGDGLNVCDPPGTATRGARGGIADARGGNGGDSFNGGRSGDGGSIHSTGGQGGNGGNGASPGGAGAGGEASGVLGEAGQAIRGDTRGEHGGGTWTNGSDGSDGLSCEAAIPRCRCQDPGARLLPSSGCSEWDDASTCAAWARVTDPDGDGDPRPDAVYQTGTEFTVDECSIRIFCP